MRPSKYLFAIQALVLISCLTRPYPATADSSSWSTYAQCSDRPVYKNNPLPADFPKEKLIAELHPKAFLNSDTKKELLCGAVVAKWEGVSGIDLFTFETRTIVPSGHGGAEQTGRDIYIALVKHDRPSVTLATLKEPIELEQDDEFAGFESRSYLLKSNQPAFAVKTRRQVMYAGGGGENIYLHLLEQSGATLDVIFSTMIQSGQFVHAAERSGGTAKVEVAKTTSKGYFDLRKIAKRGKKNSEVLAKWNGKSYVLAGKDPVKDINSFE